MTTKTTRNGDWVQTYTGRQFWPIDPRPEEIFIEDIAHSLSLICRFSGHCREFYSVAQHSVMVSYLVPEEDALWGLMHDASESYLSDIARPVKPFVENYKNLELGIEKVIAERYGMCWPMPASVKVADTIMLATEARDMMLPPADDWFLDQEPHPDKIVPVGPHDAELMFYRRFVELYTGK